MEEIDAKSSRFTKPGMNSNDFPDPLNINEWNIRCIVNKPFRASDSRVSYIGFSKLPSPTVQHFMEPLCSLK